MKKIKLKNKKVKVEKADEPMDEMNMRMFHMLKDKIDGIEKRIHQHDEAIDKLMSKLENKPATDSANDPIVTPVVTVDDSVATAAEPSLFQHYDDVCKEIDEKLE